MWIGVCVRTYRTKKDSVSDWETLPLSYEPRGGSIVMRMILVVAARVPNWFPLGFGTHLPASVEKMIPGVVG